MKKNINDIKMLKCTRYVFICFWLICSLSFTLFIFLVSILDSYYVSFKYLIVDKLGIGELRVMCRGGPYELPPSRGLPC
jgi:hypothetical protein